MNSVQVTDFDWLPIGWTGLKISTQTDILLIFFTKMLLDFIRFIPVR